MQLLRRDEVARRWVAETLSDEIELCEGVALVELGKRTILVCAPGARALVGGKPALAIALVEPGGGEFSVGAQRFRVRRSVPSLGRLGADASGIVCARCKLELRSGDEIATCTCGARLHEGARTGGGEELRCFSYAAECPDCGRSDAAEEADDGDE